MEKVKTLKGTGIKVKLLAATNKKPEDLASFAARTCYLSKPPKWGKEFDVKNKLFLVGHHSTLEHTYFSFHIEGIAVADVNFGLHLTTPYYDTDQRSGRYAKLFEKPDFSGIKRYIKAIWPEVDGKVLTEVIEYVKYGLSVYTENIERATTAAEELLKAERPFLTPDYLKLAPKIAQEQMRNFVSEIIPTGLVYTIDLATLFGLYQAASTPTQKIVTDMMAEAVLKKYPELEYMFDKEKREKKEFVPKLEKAKDVIAYEPVLKLLDVDLLKDIVVPELDDKNPTDLTTTSPFFMDNEVSTVAMEVEITTVTMGQDQRHRSYRRSMPVFTGRFYLAPILKKIDLENEARTLMTRWLALKEKVPATLFTALVPIGGMVKYIKRGNINALAHEQSKRLCFCAQEEIYEFNRQLRVQVEELVKNDNKYQSLLDVIVPPCYHNGRCAEPARYCGRDIRIRKTGNYFPKRSI
jgi:thymidylate synthase ThyX